MCLPEPDEDHKVARELSNSTQKGQLSGKKKEKKKKKKKKRRRERQRKEAVFVCVLTQKCGGRLHTWAYFHILGLVILHGLLESIKLA